MNWFNPSPSPGKLQLLIEHYTRLMAPKAGRKPQKAIAELQRQRLQKLQYIENLRLEASAMLAVEQKLLKLPCILEENKHDNVD